MSLLNRLNNLVQAPAVIQTLPDRLTYPMSNQLQGLTTFKEVGQEITVYPYDGGERYVDKGYKRNDAVYSIVSKNVDECAQCRLTHIKIKREQQKTAQEYLELKKGPMNEKVVKELGKMRKSMIENYVVDSKLSKLLNKPNRYQTQSEWIADLVGLRELQGEGNFWLNIPEGGKVPTELLNIPKPQLNLVGNGRDPWQVLYYEFVLSGNSYKWERDRVVMWKYNNPSPVDALTLEHMRGLAPLHAGIVLTQAMNEGDLRVATSNKNGGAAGLAYREDIQNLPDDVAKKAEIRRQFNNAVNSNEMANKIAMFGGKWGYFNFAVSVKDQQLLEQYNIGFKRLCRIFKTPAQIFDEGNGTWDNQKQAYRHWIYSKIGPLMNGLTGVLNEALLTRFDLDPERNIIDADIMSLPSMATDVKEQADAIKGLPLSPNKILEYLGLEPSADPNMDKIYMPSNLVPLDQLNADIGGSLEDDMKLLDE